MDDKKEDRLISLLEQQTKMIAHIGIILVRLTWIILAILIITILAWLF